MEDRGIGGRCSKIFQSMGRKRNKVDQGKERTRRAFQ